MLVVGIAVVAVVVVHTVIEFPAVADTAVVVAVVAVDHNQFQPVVVGDTVVVEFRVALVEGIEVVAVEHIQFPPVVLRDTVVVAVEFRVAMTAGIEVVVVVDIAVVVGISTLWVEFRIERVDFVVLAVQVVADLAGWATAAGCGRCWLGAAVGQVAGI